MPGVERSRSNQPLENGGWVATLEDVTERQRAAEQIAHMAHHDALTDLPNRVLFRKATGARSSSRSNAGEQLAVMYIDIDEFKSVNDALDTRSAMNSSAVAGRLRGCLGESDVAARLGGDEFAIIQIMVKNPSETRSGGANLPWAIRSPRVRQLSSSHRHGCEHRHCAGFQGMARISSISCRGTRIWQCMPPNRPDGELIASSDRTWKRRSCCYHVLEADVCAGDIGRRAGGSLPALVSICETTGSPAA